MSLLPRPARAAAAACVLSAAALAGSAAASGPARASTLPVNYDFTLGFAAGFAAPDTPPPGANTGCKPSAAHPYPVILTIGTLLNMDDDWRAAAPLLANHGYCVYTFNYGGPTDGDPDVQATREITASARQLSAFVDRVLAETGAPKVDIVGHSQGGMMPRYYIDSLGGAAKVNKLIGLAPSNYGTTVDGLTALAGALGQSWLVNAGFNTFCVACTEQFVGSPFLTALNHHPTVPGVRYTVIESRDDEVVTPYTNAFLPAAPNVTNITLQNQCPLDQSDHLEISYDPVALADVLNALDPSRPVRVPCLPVLPATGPVGPVPSF